MSDHNTFEKPEVVKEEEFTDFTVNGNKILIKMPKSSVVHLEVEI